MGLLEGLGLARTPPPPPPRLDSLTAAAARLRSHGRVRRARAEAWQDEAWDLYDQTGELRFVANVQANAVSRARVFAARTPEGDESPHPINPDDEDVTADELRAVEIMHTFGGGHLARAQVLSRIALQLIVPGDGYLIGLPPGVVDDGPTDSDPTQLVPPQGQEVNLASLTWHAMSVSEVEYTDDGLRLSVGDSKPIRVPHNQSVAVRVWRPHPRRWWQADSPTRANLPVLRELVGLTKHVGASIDSRLSSAGVLVLPQSVEIAASPVSQPDADSPTPLIDTLIEIAGTALEDRDSAAALVPLILKVPDEVAAQIGQNNLIQFSSPFDERSKELRDEAIRRLALGLDAPPELLLGLGSVNHWGQWLIKDETITTHLEPLVALIADAVTTQWFWPILEAAGVPDPERFCVGWDLSDLRQRPNRIEEAQAAHDRGIISDQALLRESGFDAEDAPEAQGDPAVQIALDLVTQAPSLVANPGLAELVRQIREVQSGGGGGERVDTGDTPEPTDDGVGPPDTLDTPEP